MEVIHEYNTSGLISTHMSHFELSSKRQRTAGLKALMGTLKEDAIVGVTCWKLKSHMALQLGEVT